MALIIIDKDIIEKFLIEEASSWMEIGGGPNLDAYEFDPKTVNREKLEKDGFYDNYDAWIAGTRVKKIENFIFEYIRKATPGE